MLSRQSNIHTVHTQPYRCILIRLTFLSSPCMRKTSKDGWNRMLDTVENKFLILEVEKKSTENKVIEIVVEGLRVFEDRNRKSNVHLKGGLALETREKSGKSILKEIKDERFPEKRNKSDISKSF